MKPFRITSPSYSSEEIFYCRISRARSVVENRLGAMYLVFRFIRIPIMLKQSSLLSVVVTVAYLNNFLRKLLFIRLRGHLIDNQIDNLFQVYGRIPRNTMRCSLSETHLD
ncbi:hypothetical protein PR048_017121, partial [Dryococelus australis]